jgi:glyoxylase-like metal-dependent hydrolase (beta-lactamase superfamily II)
MMTPVTKNVFVETGLQGCNPGFVVSSDGLVLIDSPQMPTEGKKYKKELEKYGNVKYLINTEPHRDHVGSNFMFDAIFVAHQGTRDSMAGEDYVEMLKQMIQMKDPVFIKNLDEFFLPLPQVTFLDSMTIYIGEYTLRLMHLPGHTASETAVYIPQENAVFTGDNIFNNSPSFFHEALPSAWVDSLEKLKELDAEYYIPGHGEVCRKEYLDVQISVVEEWMKTVQNAVDEGWSMEEAQERISFLDRYTLDDEMRIFIREMEKVGIGNVFNLAKEGKM